MKPETPQTQIILCPYCGHVQTVPENAAIPDQCDECRGLFEPLSRRATQISMGPWYIRDKKMPFRPGCSFEVISKMARGGRIKPTTVMRGPSTKQFWSVARNVPGIAHLLGYCHECNAKVQPTDAQCSACGTKFDEPRERNELGLAYKTAGEATAAQKALEKEIAALTGGSGGSGINRAINTPPAAPGAGLLDEVLGPGGKFGGSPLLNFGGDAKPAGGAAAPAAPKPPAPPRPAAAQPGKPPAPRPAARAAVDAFSLGDDMDDTGLDPVVRKEKLAGMWTWILVGFNALLILVVILLFLTKGGKKPTDAGPDPSPTSQGETSRNRTASTGGSAGGGSGATNASGNRAGAANPSARPASTSSTAGANPGAAGTTGAAAPPPVKAGPTPEEELAQFNQMQGLLKTAREKIDAGDSQECLALLLRVRDEFPTKWHPPDLSERITDLSTALNRAAVAEGDKARFKEMESLLRKASDFWAKKELIAALKILQDVRDNYPREWQPANLATEIARLNKQLEVQKDASFFGQKTSQ